MISLPGLLFGLVACLCGIAAAAPQPNIVVVLTDDLGFSDLGCYGSEIETPNLDQLAAGGVRFTQFYNTAKCHSSRVSLLSGRWCHQAGDESLRRAVTIPEVLAPAGYFTAMTGKWHLDKKPTDFGFQRYFGHLSGACNYYKGNNTFRLNGEPWKVPAEGFYTTVANVDHALDFLGDARAKKQPWFLYLAFNAPHAPLQPLEADYKKYLGRYRAGWDVMRAARVAKQTQMDLFGHEIEASQRPDHIPAWDKLTPAVQGWEERRMTAYAALIDRIDQELGRLIADLKAEGEFDNTIILFLSDNGACPYDRSNQGMELEPYNPKSSWSDSTGWAWARNSPFRYYKQNQFEGGIATPAIVHWPAGLKTKPGSFIHTPAHLVDVLPTLAELAGAKVPESFPGRELTPLAGVSLAPILAGGQLKERPPIHLLFAKDRGLRDGDWKIVSFQNDPWQLFNIATDRTELHNVAAEHPEIVARMVKQWQDMSANVLMAPASELPVSDGSVTDTRHREWSNYGGKNGADTSSNAKGDGRKGKGKKEAAATEDPAATTDSSPIRARRNTKLEVVDDELVLTCTEGDPGLAFDSFDQLPPGPYVLTFSLQSSASGGAEAIFTTEAKTALPNGKRSEFEVIHDGRWHDLTVPLTTDEPLHALRLDLCEGAGIVRVKKLTLESASGQTLKSWPNSAEPSSK